MIKSVVYFIGMALGGFFNRARGSRLYNTTDSTTIGRVLSMGGMALTVACFAAWRGIPLDRCAILVPALTAGLLLWCVFAWDKYWSAAIGNGMVYAARAFPPVDWFMARFFPAPVSDDETRLWGMIALTLRFSLILISYVITAYICGDITRSVYGLGCFPMGFYYYFWGYAYHNRSVTYGDLCAGANMVAMFFLTIG